MQCCVLQSLVFLSFALQGLSQESSEFEVLDEPKLLEMLGGSSGELLTTSTRVVQEQYSQEGGSAAAQFQNPFRFAFSARGSNSCPAGYIPIPDDATCQIAAASLGFSWSDAVADDWANNRPSGCFQNQGNQVVYNNDKYPGGVAYGDDKRLCQARLFGEKAILVIRIDTLDANSDYCDVECAWKLMFGPELQFGCQPTLDAATREASYGQMWFERSKSDVASVTLPEEQFGLPCDFNVVGKRARELVKEVHQKDPDSYDFVYHFLPNNMGCNFGGVAYIHGKHAYSAPGYTRNGIIKHEVGHNYGLPHARALGGPFGTPGKEDGWDTGSSMGGGVIFGTAERYMLGWISGDAVQDLGEIPSTIGGRSDFPGDPRLRAYWDEGSCGPEGDDSNWNWCGSTRGSCPASKAVAMDICQSGSAKLQIKHDDYRVNDCRFFWFAQYACTGPTTTTTTTTTTIPEGHRDVLVKVAAARHPLSTPYGPHTVLFSLWKDAVFALSYRTPHGTDGASMEMMSDRFSWVVDRKVNVHRLHGGRRQGHGIGAEVLYAGVGAGETFRLDGSPVSHRGNFTIEVCSANDDQAVVSILFHAGSNRPSRCPPLSTTFTTTSTSTPSLTSTSVTTTSTVKDTEGLTPEEAAVYNPVLASYWDLNHCGKASDNHNWAWCGEGRFTCRMTVETELCPSGKAILNFTRSFAHFGGCSYAFFAQYVCKGGIITTTVSTSTSTTTTTTTMATETTTTSSTTQRRIQGLTPEQAAMYNPKLASYWDLHHCGGASDDHNMDWCGRWRYSCQDTVAVNTSLCTSGSAQLGFSLSYKFIDGCHFAYFSQYVCRESDASRYHPIPPHRRLRGHLV